jgi:hypothetical protein
MPRAYLVQYAKDGRRHRSPLYPSYTLAMLSPLRVFTRLRASNHLQMKWLVFGGQGMHPFQIVEKEVTQSAFDVLPQEAV